MCSRVCSPCRWLLAAPRRTTLDCAAGQARLGSCFALLPVPLLLRKAGLKGSGSARWQLLRSAACAPVAPQGGANGSGGARWQLLRLAACAPVAPQGGA
ncbi:hypothetical protein [Paenibacillus xylanilyticus]|uniref:Uncharacterized protein n=1 Tax=Paenibacillus xylanilyticus TaxID=248903 RepID=A0A7Y6BSN0_9BACL|nr:hypothetical protein [Paenibacillus xylanilyticus]NUU74061.1 hypothetical protein [Paenibacillus xylanilyticus]